MAHNKQLPNRQRQTKVNIIYSACVFISIFAVKKECFLFIRTKSTKNMHTTISFDEKNTEITLMYNPFVLAQQCNYFYGKMAVNGNKN